MGLIRGVALRGLSTHGPCGRPLPFTSVSEITITSSIAVPTELSTVSTPPTIFYRTDSSPGIVNPSYTQFLDLSSHRTTKSLRNLLPGQSLRNSLYSLGTISEDQSALRNNVLLGIHSS